MVTIIVVIINHAFVHVSTYSFIRLFVVHSYKVSVSSIPKELTLGEGFPGIQLQSFQVQLASFVCVAISHLQRGPGMPAGHRARLYQGGLLQHVPGQLCVALGCFCQRPALRKKRNMAGGEKGEEEGEAFEKEVNRGEKEERREKR